MAIKIRPFGYDQVVGVTGGRHGEWLSKAGVAASVDHVTNLLVAAYGSDVRKALSDRSIVTAWETDPWVMGAYSAAMPGHGNDRSVLRKPLDDRLHFAGEATSRDFFSTAHGALITGKDAIDDIVAATA
jgi:monoamine oxidase